MNRSTKMKKGFLITIFCLLVFAVNIFGQTQDVLIKNATILTAINGTLLNTDILIQNGKITKIGKGLTASSNAKVIDATGKFISPGIIDCHSHSMMDGGINEGSYSVTSMTRTRDIINSNDITLYRALAGGVTGLNLLHGSANAIGGQNTVVKAKYGKPIEELPIPDAPPGIKFALGENPKRSNVPNLPGQTRRYPANRMGVNEVIRDAFVRARDYKAEWDEYRAKAAKGDKTAIPPRKDLELEPIVEILEGKRYVHSHGYRAEEYLALLQLAEEFGFRVRTLQHGLETYKIASEVAKHGAGVSIFSDYWGYKIEAWDAIPYNAAILWKHGVVVSINSDDDERMRRLNLDAAKVMKYGDVPEEEALKMVTLNPAKQLGIDKRTGSIEVGKDADIVIWTAHPFSSYSRVETTMIEGEIYFDRTQDAAKRLAMEKERQELEKADVNRAPGTGGGPPRVPSEKRKTEHDDAEKGGNN
ncbi:MAG TPA: amidohydrolase [Pyrinomonadaceae bacterium]|nr:amidohydrolase [Pyrinomonadaceae bacterium]